MNNQIVQEEQEEQNQEKSKWGCFGPMIALTLIFGNQIARFVEDITGGELPADMVFMGLIALAVIIGVGSTISKAITRSNQSSESRLPTGMPPETANRNKPPSYPTSANQTVSTQHYGEDTPYGSTQTAADTMPRWLRQRLRSQDWPQMPGTSPPPTSAPGFEPIINPMVLGAGLLILFVFGGVIVLSIMLSS
ncbi:MAG: hypothetical protein HC837_11160 [Chloroflexaceae bacterium]|nr:hypothetical protein [Chloroflexaceae bacterium]